MKPYIFGDRNNVHIIDLGQTVPMLHTALKAVSDTVAGGGRVLSLVRSARPLKSSLTPPSVRPSTMSTPAGSAA